MAEDLLDTIGQLFGPIRGGLALRGDPRRRDARRDHRRRGRVGDLDGPDLAADHAALRLRPAPRHRRDRRLGHAGADHPAVAGADRAGRPARPQRRRHVQGRVHPGLRADRPVPRLRPGRQRHAAAAGCRRCRRRRARSARTTARRACARSACCCVAVGRRRRSSSPRSRPATTPHRRDDRRRRCASASASRFVAGGGQPAVSSWACCRAWPSASPSC